MNSFAIHPGLNKFHMIVYGNKFEPLLVEQIIKKTKIPIPFTLFANFAAGIKNECTILADGFQMITIRICICRDFKAYRLNFLR